MTLSQPNVSSPIASGVRTQHKPPSELPGAYANVAEGMLLALPVSVVVALPVAIRLGTHPGASLLAAWIAATGAAALLLGPAVALVRAARPWPRAAPAGLLGVLLASGPLAILGSLLKASTNHRPLGAVTFALLAAMVSVGAVVVSGRLVELIGKAAPERRRVLWSVLIGVVAASPLMAVFTLRTAAADPEASPLGYGLLDGLLALALAIAAGWIRIPRELRSVGRRLGPTLWVLAVVIGLWVLDKVGLAEPMQSTAPMLGWMARWII